jgi:hypothetical protein
MIDRVKVDPAPEGDEVDELLAELPAIVTEERAGQVLLRALGARPLVFYERTQLAALLRGRLSSAPDQAA